MRGFYCWVPNRSWPRRHWKWRRLNNRRGEDHRRGASLYDVGWKPNNWRNKVVF